MKNCYNSILLRLALSWYIISNQDNVREEKLLEPISWHNVSKTFIRVSKASQHVNSSKESISFVEKTVLKN